MPEDVVVDLRRDYAAACATALNNAGYTPPASADDRIQFYWNVRHRRVPVRLRTVHRAAYVVPPLLVQGEQAFLADVAAGADLRPYQSTRLERADFNDGMLLACLGEMVCGFKLQASGKEQKVVRAFNFGVNNRRPDKLDDFRDARKL